MSSAPHHAPTAADDSVRAGMARDQLRLFFQPVVGRPGGEVSAFDALVRWEHPELGPVRPAELIARAERERSILELGTWALERACAPGRRVACRRCVARRHVNLSGSELADAGLPERVRQTLARTRLEPARLCLEVSERTVNADPERTIAALRETGVALALDDLGPDVPPLAALTELPVEVVKIDRSLRTGSAAARATARSSPQC